MRAPLETIIAPLAKSTPSAKSAQIRGSGGALNTSRAPHRSISVLQSREPDTPRTHIVRMHFSTACLLALALGVALVQAAPKKIEKKSISDAGAKKTIEQVSQNLDDSPKLADEALLEAADGQNVDRAKKQASTTFCVEIRQNKPTQVDCAELNNNQPLPSPPHPYPEPEPQSLPAQSGNFPLPEIKIDISQPSAPMGPPCEPEIAGFIAPGGDVVYSPTGNCAHNIPNTFQTPYSSSSMMPSGPGGHVHVLHIPGGFPHSGFPGNFPGNSPGNFPGNSPGNFPGNSPGNFPGNSPGSFPSNLPGNSPSTGLPGGYPAGMIPNSGSGIPSIHISPGSGGPGGFPLSGLPNGGFPNGGAGFPSIHISPGSGGPGGFPLSGLPNGGVPNGGAGFPSIHISPGSGGPGGFPMSGFPNGGLPNSGAGAPSINVIPGSGLPSGMPSGGLPNGGAGAPSIHIIPGTGLPGGFPNGGYPSGGYPSGSYPSGGYPSGASPIHVLHLPGGGLPSGPSAGGSGGPTIYITPGSGTPGVSPVGPNLPSLRPGHTFGHHHHHLKGVECTCKSDLGSNIYRSDGGMPSNEQLAAQFLDDLQKNTQQQPGSPTSMAPRSDGWSVGAASSPGDGWSVGAASSPGDGWGVVKTSSPGDGWGIVKTSSPGDGWGVVKTSSPGGEWGVVKTSSPGGEWGVVKASSPDDGWSVSSSPGGPIIKQQWPGVSISSSQPAGQTNTGKSAGTEARYMPMRPMTNSQSQVMYQQQSTASMTPGMHAMHGIPMSGYVMAPMMGPMMIPGMPMRSSGKYEDSFQSGYPMQGLRLSRGPDEADAKAAEQEEGPKPETEEDVAKRSPTNEMMNQMMKKTQDDENESKNTRLARFLMGEKDAKSNSVDDD